MFRMLKIIFLGKKPLNLILSYSDFYYFHLNIGITLNLLHKIKRTFNYAFFKFSSVVKRYNIEFLFIIDILIFGFLIIIIN